MFLTLTIPAHNSFDWTISLSIFIVVLTAGFILRKIIFHRLSKLAQNTKTWIDDLVLKSIKWPSVIWVLMAAIYIGVECSGLPENATSLISKLLVVLGLLSVTIVLSGIATRLIKTYSNKFDAVSSSISLLQTVSRIIILGTGILVILNSLGISITPILATLGVGGLAVALALQDTLSNLFAGIHISFNKIVRVGDYIKLDSGEEGYVTDITWRTTKIRMLANNIVLVPNAKLSQANITNYYFPERDLAVLVNVGVHYKSNLRHVEKITCEVAKEVMQEVSGGVPEFQPFIRYHTFGDFSINFTVILRAKEFVDQHLIKHEFIMRLHERYAKEGINIPYPIRTVNYEQEGAK